MKNNETPDLLTNEADTEEIIHGKFWQRMIKKIPQQLKHFKINEKLLKLGKKEREKK
jgi:hypothetical protein